MNWQSLEDAGYTSQKYAIAKPSVAISSAHRYDDHDHDQNDDDRMMMVCGEDLRKLGPR